MGIYLVTIGVVFLLCMLRQKNKGRISGKILDLSIILIPALVAGMRDFSIGTDVKVYGEYMYNMSLKNSLSGFLQSIGYSDILFSLLMYGASNILHNLSAVLFIIQLINCTVVYIALRKYYKNDKSLPYAYLFFMFTLYFRQLNLLRQGIALSLCIMAYVSLIKGKSRKLYTIFTIIACLFHITAIVSLLVYVCYRWFADSNNTKVNMKIKSVFLCVGVVCLAIVFKQILLTVTQLGILGEKYTYSYFAQFQDGAGIDFIGLFFRLAVLVMIYVLGSMIKSGDSTKDVRFYFMIGIIDLVSWMLNIHVLYMMRISFYFSCITFMLFLPNCNKSFASNRPSQLVARAIMVMFFAIYWYMKFVIQNAGNVYPYVIVG